MEKICLDSDFLIRLIRKHSAELEFAEQFRGKATFATTILNIFELYHGSFKSKRSVEEISLLDGLFNRIQILDISKNASRTAGRISADLEMQGQKVAEMDVLIGTVALLNGFAVKTHNKKHFSRIPGLKVL